MVRERIRRAFSVLRLFSAPRVDDPSVGVDGRVPCCCGACHDVFHADILHADVLHADGSCDHADVLHPHNADVDLSFLPQNHPHASPRPRLVRHNATSLILCPQRRPHNLASLPRRYHALYGEDDGVLCQHHRPFLEPCQNRVVCGETHGDDDGVSRY